MSNPARRPEAVRIATQLIGRSYSKRELLLSKLLPGTESDDEALYCSTFIGLCWAPGMRSPLWVDPQHKPLYPAVLAMRAMLEDVPLGWRRV